MICVIQSLTQDGSPSRFIHHEPFLRHSQMPVGFCPVLLWNGDAGDGYLHGFQMIQHLQIPATAQIEMRIAPVGKLLGVFRVTVTGALPHDYVRIYTIRAKSEQAAVLESMEKFHDEISVMLNGED